VGAHRVEDEDEAIPEDEDEPKLAPLIRFEAGAWLGYDPETGAYVPIWSRDWRFHDPRIPVSQRLKQVGNYDVRVYNMFSNAYEPCTITAVSVADGCFGDKSSKDEVSFKGSRVVILTCTALLTITKDQIKAVIGEATDRATVCKHAHYVCDGYTDCRKILATCKDYVTALEAQLATLRAAKIVLDSLEFDADIEHVCNNIEDADYEQEIVSELEGVVARKVEEERCN